MEVFGAYSKHSVDSVKSLVELNGEFLGKVLESQVSLANIYVEGSEKQLDVATGTKDPQEFVSKQTALVEEYTAKLSEFAQENSKLAEEASAKLKSWLEEGVKFAEESVKEAASK